MNLPIRAPSEPWLRLIAPLTPLSTHNGRPLWRFWLLDIQLDDATGGDL